MQSSEPMPGNPWPHDMVITIDDAPDDLLLLLFVRAAWQLAPDAVVPALSPAPDPGDSAATSACTLDEWSMRWKFEWLAAWSRLSMSAETIPWTPEELAALRPETAGLPGWRQSFGMSGIDESAWQRWRDHLVMNESSHLVAWEEQPERRALDALVPAWRSGLVRIVTLPFEGYFAERVSESTLVISAATRNEPGLYSRALATPLPL